MLLEVSSGEGFDKLSIIELKHRRIASPEKRDAVMREIEALSSVTALKETYPIEYESLSKVNEEIWDLTEILDSTRPDFAKVSERIFDLNRKRFRVKRMINNAENSNLKEQKSYGNSHCVIELDVDPYSRIPEIYSVVFDYDTFSFDRPCKLRPFPNFLDSAPETCARLLLSSIPRNYATVRPITYGCGGRLGDTVHQLSIVNETYLISGRKGVVFLSDTFGDPYDRGVLSTFDDVREVFTSQPYIHSLSVHRGEQYDVNLSQWRTHDFSYTKSWRETFQNTFKVPWNTTPWITTVPNLQYRDTTFLCVGTHRYNHVLRYQEIATRIPNMAFLCTNIQVYEAFVANTGVHMPYLVCSTFSDLASVLAGCKGIIGSLSMPLALADAMWKPRLAIMYGVDYDNTVAMLSDKRFILYTEDLDAFGWTTPEHPLTTSAEIGR